MTNCLNLQDVDVQRWINNEGIESTYSIYLQNGYLPDYNEWKQMNVGIKIEEARDVLASILPIDMFQIAPLSNIIDSLPINTVGAYLNDVIYLNETPTLSEVYEEGFHAILDRLVTPLEKSQLLKASQAVLADRLKKEGNTINNYLKEISEKYPELYNGQSREQQLNRLYEEELASMFIASKQYKNPFTLENGIKKRLSPILGNSIASSIASIITKVFNYLKSIFNMYKSNEDTISMFFKAINDGKFKGKEIQGEGSNSVPFTRLLELKVEEYDDVFEETITHIKRYTPEETQSVIRNVGAIYFQLENERIDNKKSDRIQRAIELYFQLSKEIGEYHGIDINSEINKDNVELLKQDVLSYIDEFKSIVDFDSDVIESEDETTNSFADFESSADEKDPLQSSFSKTLKLRIGKTGRVKYLSSVQIPINNEENKEVYIKLIESVDVAKTYYSIARALRNTPNDEDRWNKLMMFSDLEGNKDTKAFVEQLLFDLFRNHELVRNEGKGTPNEYESKLEKIKDLYNNRAKGFVIFPQAGEEENVISSGNAVIINSIIKGFDLYSRTNYTVTFDVLNKKAKSFDSNLKNVKKIQTDTWKNTLLELKDSEYKLSTSDKYFDNFQLSAFDVDELESKTNRVFNFFNAIKIPISREYIKYSIASNSGINEQGLSVLGDSTTDALLSTFKVPKDNLLNNNVLKELYNRVYSYLNNDGDLQELYDNDLGIKGRLDNIAEGNGYFDERIPDSTYKTADGKTKFNYQYKTWHLQKVTAMLEKPDDISTYDVLVSNDILREGRQLIESNYLFNKFKTKEFKDLIKDGKIDVFSADGIRLSEDDVLQDGRVIKKGRDEDGVSVGKMSNRDFMIYLFNLSAGKTSSAGLSPVYFGNYEASKTYEFINLPLIKDVIDDNGNITSLAIDMLSKEIEKEFNRIKEIAGTEQFETTYTKYNTGKRFKIQYKDRTFYIPYAEKNGVKSINFGNFRAGTFSDYVNNLSELEFDKPFTDYINALMNSGVTEATIEDEINSKNPLVLAYLGEDFSKAELNIAKNINDMNNNLVSMLEQQDVINGNENILIDSFYLGNNKLSTTYGFKSGELKNNLKRKIMSDFLNTMYLNQLLQGDQALLYKNDLVDIFKRFKGRNAAIVSFNTSTIAPDLGITEKWETLNYVVHSEIESRSGIDTGNIDQADAQNYTTTKYMRHALYAMGRLTKDTASLLDKIEQGEPIDESIVFNMEVYTPILKTVHFDGRNYLKKSDYMLSKSVTSRFVEINESEALKHGEINSLTKQWQPSIGATKEVVKWSNGKYYEVLPNQNKELHGRRKVMEGWRYDKINDSWSYAGNQIMLSMPISASKMLNRNTLRGHDLKNLEDKNINTLDLQYYGLQVETPHPHDTIPDPTQYLEIALNELNRTRSTEFIIDGNKYNVDQLENLYQEALVQRRAMRIDSLMNEILDENNNPKLDEFRERFAKSLISSGAEKQTVELVAEGYNMNIPLIRDKYISQIFSHFTKDGLSQKRKGDAAAHISSYGHKLVKKVVKHTVNGNDVWSWVVIPSGSKEYNDALSTELNDYSSRDFYPDVNGKPSKNREKHILDGKDNSLQTALSELGEGQYFIDELRHLKPRIVDGVITGYFTEMILAKYDRNQSQISDEERYMFGVRIPSQDKHSGVNLEWVDMLPPNYGSAVIVAKEIVQLSGSDFDIDKLYISKPEGYYTKEGFKKYTNSFEDFIKYQLANNRELKQLLASDVLPEDYSMVDFFDTLITDEDNIIRGFLKQLNLPYNEETYDEYISKYGGYGNRGYINNLLLQANQQALGNEQTLDSGGISDTPASMGYMAEGVLKEFELMVDGNKEYLLSKDGKKYVNANKTKYNVHHLLGQIITDKNNRTGKANIGVDVNWNLLNIVLNRLNAPISKDNSISVTINGENKTFDSLQLFLLEPVDGSNLRVFDVISTLISSATDEAKEQLNARYGLNIDALNAVLPFVAMGGNLSIALALVNQPIVKMFLEYKDKKNYAITTEDESKLKTLSTFGIVEKILDSIGLPKNALDSIDNVTYSIEDLALGLRGKTKINSPASLKMLNDFLKLVEITEWGSNLVAVIKLKKGVPSDIYSFETQLSKINALQLNNKEVDGSEYPINIKKALLDNKDTKAKELIGAIDVVNKIASILPKFVAIKSNAFNTIRESVIKEAKRLNNDNLKELNSELESFIYGQYYNELLKDAGVEDASIIKYITTLLIDKDAEQNIKNEFIKFKNASKNSDVLRNNPLLNKLEIMENDNIVGLKLNQLVKLSDTQMTELSDAYTFLTKLKEPLEDSISPNEFSKMLFALYIVKDGFQFKYDGVSKIFPAEMFSRLSTVIQDVQDNKFDGDKYKDVFIERYFESVKHTNQINFISPKSINTSDFKLIGNQDEFKIAYFNRDNIQSLDDNNSNNTKDGNVLRYIRIGWDKNVYLMKYKGVDGNNYVYEEFIPSGNSNITTMSIPLNESIYSAPIKYNKKQQEITLNKGIVNESKKTINVYWSQAESDTSTRILSNLSPRKLTYESTDGITREYGSVEHAYQSNKNGKFDATTYNDYVAKGGYGVKISPKLTEVGKRGNLQLMKDLVVESFIQNPNSEAFKKLLQYDEFTHNTNELIDKAFLEGLYLAKKEIENKTENTIDISQLKPGVKLTINTSEESFSVTIKSIKLTGNSLALSYVNRFGVELAYRGIIKNNKMYPSEINSNGRGWKPLSTSSYIDIDLPLLDNKKTEDNSDTSFEATCNE